MAARPDLSAWVRELEGKLGTAGDGGLDMMMMQPQASLPETSLADQAAQFAKASQAAAALAAGLDEPPSKRARLEGPSGEASSSVEICRCWHCTSEGNLSLYCISCGHSGNKCNECGNQAKLGSFDPTNSFWYCKGCWIKNTPEGAVGPFKQSDAGVQPSADSVCGASDKAAEGEDGETVSSPNANDNAKKAHWAQVFATLQQTGLTQKALEYAQCLRKLRSTIQDVFSKYKDALASEEELLQSAYTEALEGNQVRTR